MSRVFLSHSSANNAEAVAIRDWLISFGWEDMFLDLDPERGLKAGERWQAALKQAAERCEVVIFLVSPVWAASKWCLAEYLLACNLNKRIIGVIVEETPFADLPTELTAEWQLVDLTAGIRDHEMTVSVPPGDRKATVSFSQEGLNRLRIGLMQAGLDPNFFAWPPEHDPDRAPYRGLRALEAEDAGIFFGRAGPIVIGTDLLRGLRDAPPPRLAVILGASGSGKSSFMRAGLLPRLAREEGSFLPLPVIRPERAVITGETGLVASLEHALKAAGQARRRADVRKAVEGGAVGVQPLLAALVETKFIAGSGRPPTVIVPVDQAEELFVADNGEEAAAFLDILGHLVAGNQPGCVALFTIRSDHYEMLQTAKALEGMRQQFLSLPPMPKGSFADVIRGPAARLTGGARQLTIEEPLVDALLEDIETGGAKDALPLLAFTLERLYREYGGEGRLNLDEYEQLGRIRGSIEAAVQHALRQADAVPAIPADHKTRLELLRRGLVPWLAGIDPDTCAPRRRIARISEIPPESLPLLKLLVEQRLLATDISKDTGEVTIEPAHEALLRQWGLLEKWLEEDFEDLATLDGIKRASRDWDANDRGAGWVTHVGGRLEAAERVAARDDFNDVLDEVEQAYLFVARNSEDARTRAELLLLRRDRRRSRILAGGAVAVALVMAALGWVMYGQWQNALRTESLFLADMSRMEINGGDPVTGALLALEALSDADSDRLSQAVRPFVPAAQGALDAATSEGLWHDRLILRHPDPVTAVAVAADGSRFVTGSIDHVARVWDGWSGNPIAELTGHDDRIFAVALTPDGRIAVTGSNDGTARLWDAGTGELLAVFKGHTGRVLSVAVSADGSRVVTGSDDSTARLWDAGSGTAIREFKGHRSGVSGVAVTPDSTRILTGSWDWTARLWDAASGEVLSEFKGHTGAIRAVAMSADGTRVVTGSRDETARLHAAASGALIAKLAGHTDAVFGVAVTADGGRVITGSWDKTMRIWSGSDGAPLAVLKGHTGIVRSAAVTADGRRIVTGAWDETARVWEPAGGKQTAELKGHSGAVVAAAAMPDGRGIVTASRDGTARLWNAADGRLLQSTPLGGEAGEVRSVAVSSDGGLLVTGSANGMARLWDLASGRKITEFRGHSASVTTVAQALGSSRVVTGSEDGTVRVWDAGSGSQLALFHLREGRIVHSVAVAPDGNRIVAAADDPRVWILDAGSGTVVSEFKGHTDAVLSVAMTPDGRHIVSASKDKTVRLWDTGGGSMQTSQVVSGTEPVMIVVVAPDGRRIVTGSDDGAARIWDTATGQHLAELGAHSSQITALAFSPDGGRVVTGSEDGLALVWDGPPPPQTLIERSKDTLSRCLTTTQRLKYHLAEEVPRWCYEKKKWPFDKLEPMPQARWYVQPFVATMQWLTAQTVAVLQLVPVSEAHPR